jgi:4-hydroxy-2-oxoheptanedioate aldolase
MQELTTMRENTMKKKLGAGQPVFGSMITFPSPVVVEMLGYLGYDWVLIDNEHGSITIDLAEDMIRAAEYSGTAPIVRPVGNRPEIIAPFLDRGAWGVQVPHVNTADEARAAVDAVKYYPDGHRGIFSRSRPAGYGFSGSTGEYVAEANRNTLVCLMLEEVEAIDNLESMVQVEGVDVYFIGSGDLSQSMGYPGQQTHPEVQALMERGVEVITRAGRVAGVSCPDNLVPKFLDLGVQYFHGNVNSLLQTSSVTYLESMRVAAVKAGL